MEITTRRVGNCVILDCDGKIVFGPATKAVREAVREAAESKPNKVIMNLKGVNYIDSTGVGELISSYTHAQNMGTKLVLLNLDARVHQVLVIAKIYTVFEIFGDEKSALAGC